MVVVVVIVMVVFVVVVVDGGSGSGDGDGNKVCVSKCIHVYMYTCEEVSIVGVVNLLLIVCVSVFHLVELMTKMVALCMQSLTLCLHLRTQYYRNTHMLLTKSTHKAIS